MSRIDKHYAQLLVALGLVSVVPLASGAETVNALEEIIVTATKRESSLMETAASGGPIWRWGPTLVLASTGMGSTTPKTVYSIIPRSWVMLFDGNRRAGRVDTLKRHVTIVTTVGKSP